MIPNDIETLGDRDSRSRSNDVVPYALAAICGIVSGIADILVSDLLFTALLVLAASMFLGTLRPRAPWRWVVVVVIFVPLTELFACAILHFHATRGQVWGSFLTALPAIAGAYGGAVMRRVIDNLRAGR